MEKQYNEAIWYKNLFHSETRKSQNMGKRCNETTWYKNVLQFEYRKYIILQSKQETHYTD